jgi:hypothetical protein
MARKGGCPVSGGWLCPIFADWIGREDGEACSSSRRARAQRRKVGVPVCHYVDIRNWRNIRHPPPDSGGERVNGGLSKSKYLAVERVKPRMRRSSSMCRTADSTPSPSSLPGSAGKMGTRIHHVTTGGRKSGCPGLRTAGCQRANIWRWKV